MIRKIILGVGLLALLLVIWVGGPLVSFGDSTPLASIFSRIVVTLLLVLAWVGKVAWKKFNGRKFADKLMASLPSTKPGEAAPENAAATEDIAAIRKNLQDALTILKKTRMKGVHGERELGELPWYIMIGPPGAGKTTALLNSGLRFPLRDQFGDQAMRGVGGTRGCDWWFSDEAVLIDTAGRYTTQDSDADVDSAGWGGFLDLLKKHRSRRPINGVLVAISLADLMQQNEQERRLHATAVKRRIQELQDRLGVKFPVYVLFTKTDLVAGFTEFFDDLGKEERAQVWGMSFPLDTLDTAQGVVERFGPEFDGLLERLNSRLVTRLYQERDITRRALIQNFPYQMASLKPVADGFLQEVFRPSQFEGRFLLRGVYFTSGTQEGTPIDRIMGSLATTFGLDRQTVPSFSGRGRSYFLTRLFRQVIFQESGIGGTSQRVARQQQLLQWGSYGTAAVATVAATAVWTVGYTRNVANIETIQAHVTEYERQRAKLYPDSLLQQTLPALYTLREAGDVYNNDPIGLPAALGMSKEGSLASAAKAAYHRALRAEFLPRLAQRLEYQLRVPDAPADFLQSALKVYLMLGDTSHLNPEMVKRWMELDWKKTFSGNPGRQEELKEHLDALLSESFAPIEVNETLVVLARSKLNRVPLPERVYARLKQEAMMLRELTLKLDNVVGRNGQSVFSGPTEQGLGEVSGLFTYKGFHDFYQKEAVRFSKEFVEETWVMGEQMQDSPLAGNYEALNEQVRRLYIRDYIKTWDKLLADLTIVRFNDIEHGVQLLETLSGNRSPLRSLLQAVKDNTYLTRPSSGADAAQGALEAVAKKAKRLAKAVMAAQDNLPGTTGDEPGADIELAFVPMIELVQESDAGPAPLEDVIAMLAELHDYLAELAAADSSTALQAAAQRMSGGARDAIGKLRAKASRLPGPVQAWMEQVTSNAWRVVLAKARSHINSVWRLDVLPEYERSLRNRYPLFKRSSQDVTLADFGSFFGEDGVMDKFFANYLEPFVDTRRREWRMRPLEGQALPLSKAGLLAFQRARLIRDMYFTRGGQQPLVPFSLRPVKLDRDISRFSLVIDGQALSYRHGPTRWEKLQWPGPGGDNIARISFESRSGSMKSDSTEGEWSLFRLLDRGRLRATSNADRLRLTFTAGNYKAQYELRAASVTNPFRLKALNKFRAPENL